MCLERRVVLISAGYIPTLGRMQPEEQPEELPVAEFAFPGPLRDQLVAAIVSGAKTTTTALIADYEHEGEPLPRPGGRQVVIDSAGRPVTVIETVAEL